MSAEFLVGVVMAALAHEIQVKFGEDTGEGIRVVSLERVAVVRTAVDLVTGGRGAAGLLQWQEGLKKAFGTHLHGFDNARRCRL
jgi:hypothetical protein